MVEMHAANAHVQLSDAEQATIQATLERQMGVILTALRIDQRNDPNAKETAKRWAKMMVREAMAGRFGPKPVLTAFPNTLKVDEMVGVGPITIRSMCSHHLVPIIGRCWIGVIPGKKLLGLSKYGRIAQWVAARPQIQEEMVMQIADEIEAVLEPRGIAVVVKAAHLCMSWRGVKEGGSEMTSSVMRGFFRLNDSARQEFIELVSREQS